MKITFVLPTLDLTGGGRVVSIYARGLQDRGHDVVVVVPIPAPRSIARAVKDFLRRGVIRANRPEVANSHFQGLGVDVHFVKLHDIKSGGSLPLADILIATWWETMEWVNCAPLDCGKKVYLIQHHELFSNLPHDRVRATYRMKAKKITVARWIADTLTSEYGQRDITVIPNAVDHKTFSSPIRFKQPTATVGFIYSTTEFKAVHVALEAIQIIRKAIPSLRVVSFGSQQPTARLPLPPGTQFHFQPSQKDIPMLYGSCDVWICASDSEGFGLPAMEAMACGTPVVSTRTGWPEEGIVDGENGYLASVGDAAGLAKGCLQVIGADNMTWLRMSTDARATAVSYDWQTSIDRLELELKHLSVDVVSDSIR